MKKIIIAITTLLFCNPIYAQNLFTIRQLDKTDFKSELNQTAKNLYSNNLLENRLFYSGSHKQNELKYPLIASASTTPYIHSWASENSNLWHKGIKPDIRTRTLISAGLFIPTVVTGYSMRGSNGKPNDGLLAIHKLSAVSNLILLDTTVLKKRKTTSLSWLESVVAITMNVSFAATIATGSMQSIDRTVPAWVNTSHQITPWVTILSTGALLYLLNR